MKEVVFAVADNRAIAKDIYRMTLAGDVSGVSAAGQFVNVALDGFYLRRPISVCDVCDDTLTLVYKTVGKGTEAMSALQAGAKVPVLTGLGNGYDTSASGDAPLLIGGGVGVPPLYLLAKKLIAEKKRVRAVLGFNRAEDVFFVEEFAALGAEVSVTTADGSLGTKGFVTDALPESCTYFYACGPMPMLRAVRKKTVTGGEFSLEERMGCGFGACMGCSIQTTEGAKRVCRDGPVFRKEVLLWDD